MAYCKLKNSDVLRVECLQLNCQRIQQLFALLHCFQKHPPEVFYKKKCSEKLTKFAGKHLCQGLFLNKIASLRPAAFFKRDSGTDVFL